MVDATNIIRISPIQDQSPHILTNGVEIRDMTLLPRAGVKGAGTAEFLTSLGLTAGENVNKAYRQENGGLVARLAPSEILWLGPLPGKGPYLPEQGPFPTPSTAGTYAPGAYNVPRADGNYWFNVQGAGIEEGFARACSIDLRPKNFADLDVAQTQFAKTSAIIIRDDENGKPSYHLLGDISLASYIWDCLAKMMDPD